MQNNAYYSITTKRFVLRTRHAEWLEETQQFFNQILEFYYRLFLEHEELVGLNNQKAARTLEMLTIVGRDKKPVPNPLPWEKVPLYFRRAAVNAAIAAGRSYLARDNQKVPAEAFHKSVTYYKGMYRDLSEREISLRVWNGECWEWLHCRLSGNHVPENAQWMSPSVVIRGKEIFLHVPVKGVVSDGRKAKERMSDKGKLCSVQFTNDDAVVVCVILDSDGRQDSVHFIKGGKQYGHQCRLTLEKLEKSQKSLGGQKENQPNKKYWMKLKNSSEYFSNCISRQIINICMEREADIIILPQYADEYTRMVMTKVGNWSPLHLSYRIREQLGYKAWKEGILILEVDVKDISSKCSKCGADIKKEKDEFICPNGHRGNRYVNSAVNLGRKCILNFGKHAKKQRGEGKPEEPEN